MPNGGYTDDGLILEEVGPWAKEKHRLVGYYAGMFARSLKRKWKNRIYIDLFSGPGLSVIKETGEIVDSSAFKAMDIKEPFDRYYFCDCDHEKVDALRQRQDRYFPAIDAEFFHCDANAGVEELKASLPTPSREESMLCFTLLDMSSNQPEV